MKRQKKWLRIWNMLENIIKLKSKAKLDWTRLVKVRLRWDKNSPPPCPQPPGRLFLWNVTILSLNCLCPIILEKCSFWRKGFFSQHFISTTSWWHATFLSAYFKFYIYKFLLFSMGFLSNTAWGRTCLRNVDFPDSQEPSRRSSISSGSFFNSVMMSLSIWNRIKIKTDEQTKTITNLT